jgi:hypothetical protein
VFGAEELGYLVAVDYDRGVSELTSAPPRVHELALRERVKASTEATREGYTSTWRMRGGARALYAGGKDGCQCDNGEGD